MAESHAYLRFAVIVVASALCESLAEAPAAAAAPDVIVLRDTQLDPAALYFVSFDGLVNNASYQQSAILSFAGYQYAAWYTASRDAVVARRRLDSADNAYVVLPFGRIVTASQASGWTDWTLRFDAATPGAFGEVVIDRSRVASDGVLSILYQRSSSGTTPSPIRVLDVQID